MNSSRLEAVCPGGAEPRRELSSGCLSGLGAPGACRGGPPPPPVRRRPRPGLQPQVERGTQGPGRSVAVWWRSVGLGAAASLRLVSESAPRRGTAGGRCGCVVRAASGRRVPRRHCGSLRVTARRCVPEHQCVPLRAGASARAGAWLRVTTVAACRCVPPRARAAASGRLRGAAALDPANTAAGSCRAPSGLFRSSLGLLLSPFGKGFPQTLLGDSRTIPGRGE